ncbi:AAA family ATPase [Amycolatopsis lurida]
MARFIHLNGPSGVGKSTTAQRYVDAHPGVLNLDIDRVVSLIGGWQDNFFSGALTAGRALAITMAESHLRSGHDVVMPQLVTKVEQAQRFEAAVARAGGEYVEIALTVGKQEQAARFQGRASSSDWARHMDTIVTRDGGPVLLARIHDHFSAYLAERPECVVVPTDGLDADATYAAVAGALSGPD